jgi:hypothetical protein
MHECQANNQEANAARSFPRQPHRTDRDEGKVRQYVDDQTVWYSLRCIGVVAGVVLLGDAGHAATSEARRHINAQGIEFIGGRQTTPIASIDSLPVAPARPVKTDSRPPTLNATAAPARGDRPTVSVKEQKLRDQDRLEILQQELSAETGHYQRTRQALDDPAVNGRADRQAWLRLSEQLARHEQNIKALHAEIRRTQPAVHR